MNKVCNKCNIEKDLDDFPKCIKSKSGYRNECRNCLNRANNLRSTPEKRKLKYLKNREGSIESTKNWHKNNKDRRNEWRRNYNKKRRSDLMVGLKDILIKFDKNVFSK